MTGVSNFFRDMEKSQDVVVYSIYVAHGSPIGAYDLIRLLDKFNVIRIHFSRGTRVPYTTKTFLRYPLNMDIPSHEANSLAISYSLVKR